MHPLLEKIFETRTFKTNKNEIVPVHSETSKEQCAFLQTLIRDHGCKRTIEIGLAFGMSTLAIAEAVAANGGKAVAIDPYENDYWHGYGLDLIAQAGYNDTLEFVEVPSYFALPRFVQEGRTFDFAYIDTVKLIEPLMVDFFFLDKLLDINGIVVFDDVTFPSIRKLLRYLSQLPHYEVIGQMPRNKPFSSIRKILLRPLVPNFMLKEEVRITDSSLGISTHCVALRKTGKDERPYDWYTPF